MTSCIERICSSVSTETSLWAGRPRFNFPKGQWSLFVTMPRPALGHTQPPVQWVSEALTPGVERPGREADNSSPFCVEVKNAWSYISTPPVRVHGVVLSGACTERWWLCTDHSLITKFWLSHIKTCDCITCSIKTSLTFSWHWEQSVTFRF